MKSRNYSQAPHARPLRARALALPRTISAEEIWVITIKAFFAVTIPFLLLALTGCDDSNMNGEKVDFGPQASEKQVVDAVYTYLIGGTVPSATKAGAFVHFATTEDIGGGTLIVLAADTGQTTISRVEDTTARTVTFNIVEKVVQYHQDSSNPEKLSRNFDLTFDKPAVTGSSIEGMGGTETDSAIGANVLESLARFGFAPLSEATLRTSVQTFAQALRASSHRDSLTDHTQADPSPTPSATPSPGAPANEPPAATYHRLRTWEDQGPPPNSVRSQPNCGGIPGCILRYKHVVFDIVTHDGGDNLIHMELVASPDVPQTFGLDMNPIFPYLPGLIRTCYTRMISVGTDGTSKTLLGDCNDAVNFTFDINALTNVATPLSSQ